MRILVVVDSIGAEYGAVEYSFGDIADVDISPSREVLVLDRIGCCVKVYSADGEFIRQIGRHGSGPGEMLAPVFMDALGDGSICVRDESGWLTLSADGAYMGLVQPGASSPMQMISVGSSDLVGIRSHIDQTIPSGKKHWKQICPDQIRGEVCGIKLELLDEVCGRDSLRI
jgi:hypothetical protein